ncbi:hypothetical protein GYMLUDRAFT_239435 [Collybiopsis luxurians FD-317 M1]|nr:hypothetical protein GYMLUDRAFT_239435 [Collybiopsis luxurians FD-317 M1]
MSGRQDQRKWHQELNYQATQQAIKAPPKVKWTGLPLVLDTESDLSPRPNKKAQVILDSESDVSSSVPAVASNLQVADITELPQESEEWIQQDLEPPPEDPNQMKKTQTAENLTNFVAAFLQLLHHILSGKAGEEAVPTDSTTTMPSFSADLSDSEMGHEPIDCSSYLHSFDTKARSHIHKLPDATQLRDSTPAIPITRSVTVPCTLTAPPVSLALTAPPASTTVTARPSPAPSPPPPNPSMSQQSLDQLMHSLIQQVAALTTSLQSNISVTTKSSMVKPDPFKGQSSAEARRFIAHFESWASEQSDLKGDEAKAIKAALGFLSGGAVDWATPYLSAFNAKQVLFNRKWVEFLQAFKLRFKFIDPGMEAHNAIKKVQQGKGQTIAEFAQKFKDIGDRRGLSDTDLWEWFYSGLLPEICQHLIIVNIAQGLAQTLDEAIRQAISVDVYLHDPA